MQRFNQEPSPSLPSSQGVAGLATVLVVASWGFWAVGREDPGQGEEMVSPSLLIPWPLWGTWGVSQEGLLRWVVPSKREGVDSVYIPSDLPPLLPSSSPSLLSSQ